MMNAVPMGKFFTPHEMGTVLFALALTVIMAGMLVFSYAYHTEGGEDLMVAQQTTGHIPAPSPYY